MFKKLFSLFAALTLSAGLWAVDNVAYIDANGQLQHRDGVTEITNSSVTLSAGWYVVNGSDVQTGSLICNGEVHLILADNAKLTATGSIVYGSYCAAIQVSGESNSLTIYAQSTGEQMGQLIANSRNIEGPAGIGGGYEGSGSNITINGGNVTAIGSDLAAGIGGGDMGSGSNITINGGIVTATGGDQGAGIGGGERRSGSNITINGGTVTATGHGGAGIGGGKWSNGSNITINGGTVTANGGYDIWSGDGPCDGIGNGYQSTSLASNIYISDAYILKAGAAADPTEVIAHSSAQDMASSLNGKQYVKIEGLATPYTRSMTIDNWATVCLPYDATSFEGADFYKVNYYDASNPSDLKLYIEPVDNLVAGMPYIFQATADVVTIEHAGVATLTYGEEQNFLGLYGSFARKTIAYDGAYAYAAIAGGAVVIVGEGNTVTVPACRAYFDMNEVPTTEQPHSAPLRVMGTPRQQPTDLETVDGSQCTMHTGKYIINGQFVIVKDGKKYNALGF